MAVVRNKVFKGFMSAWSIISLMVLLLAGCGGGGGGETAGVGGTGAAKSGIAVDPYISGAVFQEVAAVSGALLQESTPSDDNGNFAFDKELTPGSLLQMKPGAKGMHNGVAFTGSLKRVVDGSGTQVVSPLTTLMANGLSADEVVSVLKSAGLATIHKDDVTADPMAGLADRTTVTEADLVPLQAAVAVNSFFQVMEDYSVDHSLVVANQSLMTKMVGLAKETINPNLFNPILASYQETNTGNTVVASGKRSRFNMRLKYLLRAAVNINETVVTEVRANPATNAPAQGSSLAPATENLAVIYYVGENRGEPVVEEAVSGGAVPDVKAGQVPVVNASTGAVTVATPAPAPVAPAPVAPAPVAPAPVAPAPVTPAPVTPAPVTPAPVTPAPVAATPGAFQFSASAYSVNESAGKINITINRVGGSAGPASVEWRTWTFDGYGTADWANDYGTFLWTTVNFAAGETSKVLPITINNDNLVEGNETFTILLQNPTGGATIGGPATAVVTILDDDVASPAPVPAPVPPVVSGPVKVFPGAQGFGTGTLAGRGGQVIKVTNLNDSGPGSFRAAVSASGPRIVVFEVGGSIELKDTVYIQNPFLTIAGQTAPEPGIQVKNYGIEIDSHDVLVQHVRFRVSGGERDCVRIFPVSKKVYNIVLDHVTANWGSDENISIYGPGGASDITISNSLIAEAGYGLLIGSDEKTPNHLTNISVINNIFAHNSERNPMIKHNSNVFVANNLEYNATWGFVGLIGDFASQMKVSLVGNYYITGANNLKDSPIIAMSAVVSGLVYEKDCILTGVVSPPMLNSKAQSSLTTTPPIWDDTVSIVPASQVKGKVMPLAGARPAFRDAVEQRIVNEVATGTGSLKSSGAWPTAYNSPTYRAFDAGSNPNGDDNKNGYTNIEEILYQMALKVEGK